MSDTTTTEDVLDTPADVASRIKGNTRTLERWRTNGTGPAFVKVGRRVLYRRADVDAYLARQTRQNTADDGGNR